MAQINKLVTNLCTSGNCLLARVVEAEIGHPAQGFMVPVVKAVLQALYLPPMFLEETGAFFGLQGVDRHVSHSDAAVIEDDEILKADEGREFKFGFRRFDLNSAAREE